MGGHVTSKHIPIDGEYLDKKSSGAARRVALLVAFLGSVASVLIFLGYFGENPRGIYTYSWLFALVYFVTIALGGCFWTLLHNVSNSGWGTSLRRIMENLGAVFPFLAIFSVPLLFPEIQQYLYEWMARHRVVLDGAANSGIKEALKHTGDPHDYLLAAKAWYLNIPFWYGRFIFYFVGMGLVIWVLRGLSVGQDKALDANTKRLFRARGFSAIGLPVFAITITFLAIDWVKALDYTWFSTMWGVYVFAGSGLSSMAVIIIVSIILRQKGHMKHVVSGEHDHLTGKLAFAFTAFWAYIAFSQFFLIWYANIAEETRFYLLRSTGHWHSLTSFLLYGHFAVPFLLLLRQDLKRKNSYMLFMASYLLFMHALDVYQMIIPERAPSSALLNGEEPTLWVSGAWVYDLVAFITIGAGFIYFMMRNTATVAIYPHRDPRILESANVHN